MKCINKILKCRSTFKKLLSNLFHQILSTKILKLKIEMYINPKVAVLISKLFIRFRIILTQLKQKDLLVINN